MSYIPTSLPPANLFASPHNYNVTMGSGLSTGRIGGKINPVFEDGSKYTPEQKKRIISISIIACTAIAAAALLIAGCITGLMPLIFVAIPLFAISLGVLIWFLVTKKPDLDSPQTRREIQDELASSSFDQIVKRHNVHDIVGYGLLDGVPMSVQNRPQFYGSVIQLKEGDDRVAAEHAHDQNLIENAFSHGTAPLTYWRNNQALQLQHRNALYDMAVSPLYYGRPRHRAHGIATVAAIGSAAMHLDAHMTMSDVNHAYAARMSPWYEWRSSELAKINHSFLTAKNEIQERYNMIKAAAI